MLMFTNSLAAPQTPQTAPKATESATSNASKKATLKDFIIKINSRTAKLEQKVQQLQTKLAKQPKATKKVVVKKKKKASYKENYVFATAFHNFRRKLGSYTDMNKFMIAKKEFSHALHQRKLKDIYPRLEIGGALGAKFTYKRPYIGPSFDDINLNSANLYTTAEVNDWFVGLVSMNYDSGSPPVYAQSTPGGAQRVSNSRVFLSRAFITAGDLNQAPFYVTMGQAFMPFGNFKTKMGMPPITARLGRFLSRALIWGYQPQDTNFNASVFLLRGSTRPVGKPATINNGGFDISYIFGNNNIQLQLGSSYVANIADSSGMQDTAAPFKQFDDADTFQDQENDEDDDDLVPLEPNTFTGFGSSNATEQLVHRVSAANFRARLSIYSFVLLGEYLQSTRPFAVEDLTFNENGARPSAYHVEANYLFNLFHLSHTLAAGFSQSYQSLALNAPEKSVGVALRTNLLKNIFTLIGYQYEINYGYGNTGTGREMPSESDNFVGKNSKTFIAGINLMF
jgi:hypothetical protein